MPCTLSVLKGNVAPITIERLTSSDKTRELTPKAFFKNKEYWNKTLVDYNTIVRCIIKLSICLRQTFKIKLQLHFDKTCLNESPVYGTLDVTENICIPNK